MTTEERRKLTDQEREHAAHLLFRCTERQLAAHLGCKEAQLSRALRQVNTIPVVFIVKLLETTREQLPPRPPRPKAKLFSASVRSSIFSYPRKPLH